MGVRENLPDELDFKDLADRAVTTARRWTDASREYPVDRAAKLLAEVLSHPGGLDFTVGFVDGIIRPEDLAVAATKLSELSRNDLSFLPWYLKIPAKIGGAAAPLAPGVIIPIARRVFAKLVGDLVVDVSEAKLGPALERIAVDGSRLNVNLLGEAVLGSAEAKRRLEETRKLLSRDDIDYVSLKVSAVTGPHNPWGYSEVVSEAVEHLLPLYELAAASPDNKFINLDMEEYHDLHLTIDVFKRILDRPSLQNLESGIVIQTYLPDALDAVKELQSWAQQRVSQGGSRIKIRIVKGANLAMETVDAQMHGWALTTYPNRQQTDSNYLRVLSYAMHPEHIANIRLGVAGHNIFTIAMAWEMAGVLGVREGVEIEMLAGMATQQAAAVRAEVGKLLLYVPVVHPEEYDVAIAYLVRRLEENAAPENFMSAVFDLSTSETAFARERDRFLAAAEEITTVFTGSNRKQNRLTESADDIAAPVRQGENWVFANTSDSDPALPANLEWARAVIGRIAASDLGKETAEAANITTKKALNEMLSTAVREGKRWGSLPASERAEILHRAGVELGLARAELLEVAASECGKTIDQADVEISEAIDFCHYYATQAANLEQVVGAEFVPSELTVVTPPWNFPIAIPAGSTVSALAAGSAVILKPASSAKRCAAVLAEVFWRAGVPRDVLYLATFGKRELGQSLIADKRVEKLILTGSADTASLFRSWRPDLPILAETSGKNAIVVTPAADLDLAVKDVVQSAFGHAGQKCSAASLVILVGSAGFSRRFHDQLVDAVASLRIAYPDDPTSQMGPLITAPEEKLHRGLTSLGLGEHWEVEPKQLDDTGRLWSPGVRSGVRPGSEYHLTEYFGPILGVMRAQTLSEAIEWQNGTDFGLTAGLHSLDPTEIQTWLAQVEAGNLYVNRGITGAIVQRQPFGGWKRSTVGIGAKAGGPNYLFGLGAWKSRDVSVPQIMVTKPTLVELLDISRKELPETDFAELETAVRLDQIAAETEFDAHHDPSALAAERNVLRYLSLGATVRFSEGEPLKDLLRVISAAFAAGNPVQIDEIFGEDEPLESNRAARLVDLHISSATALPEQLVLFLSQYGVTITVENDDAWLASARENPWGLDGRIRLIGGDPRALAEALDGAIDVAIWSNPVTPAGRIEILPFVHEQAVSITNHRFGNPTPLGDSVL